MGDVKSRTSLIRLWLGKSGCDMNYLAAGKWYRSTARMAGATSDTFQVEVTAEKQDGPFNLRIDQPGFQDSP